MIFIYTTIVNVIERPDGVRIAGLFILGHPRRSRSCRASAARSSSARPRSPWTRRRSDFVTEDAEATTRSGSSRMSRTTTPSRVPRQEPRRAPLQPHPAALADHLPRGLPLGLLGLRGGPRGARRDEARLPGAAGRSANVPNTIAAVLLEIRDQTGTVPDVYFEWTAGQPDLEHVQVPHHGKRRDRAVTREVLRAKPNRVVKRRPTVHVS